MDASNEHMAAIEGLDHMTYKPKHHMRCHLAVMIADGRCDNSLCETLYIHIYVYNKMHTHYI